MIPATLIIQDSSIYEASDSLHSNRIITGGIGTDVTYRAGTIIRLQTGFHAKAGNKFKAVLGPCSGTEPPAVRHPASESEVITE